MQTQIQTQSNSYNDLQNKSKLAEEQCNRIIKDLQLSIQELEGSYEATLTEMLKIKKEGNIFEGEDFILFLNEKIHKYNDIYKEFVDDNLRKGDSTDKDKWPFLKYLVEKFEHDNVWLLESLKHLKNELQEKKINIADRFNNEKDKVSLYFHLFFILLYLGNINTNQEGIH